jgi:hypothetical protein
MSETAVLLRGAREILRTRGRAVGDYQNAAGQVCLSMALHEASLGQNLAIADIAHRLVRATVREQFPGRCGVVDFNDDLRTTDDDVMLVLDKAIARAEEMVTE